jgi:hypothetical protein
VDRLDLPRQAPHADAVPARHRPVWHERHEREAEPGFHHANDDLRGGRLHLHVRGNSNGVERVEHMLPAGGPALEEDERNVGEVGERQPRLAQERVPGRGDQAPVE